MDPSRAKSIFLFAVEELTPDEWPAYLESTCAGDEELYRSVSSLLEAHAQAGDLAEQGQLACRALLPNFTRMVLEELGTQIGPYELLEQLGEGGMGVVYLAQQKRPVQRKVALKLIKPGLNSRQVVARFEAERQTLALMDHPNIARVLDAGVTDTGQPYFVMELVHGTAVTEFCDNQRLTIRQRLELLVPVCQAVQHAHLKGIIHRDIKPSNVMITLCDDRAVPKVIDFGVAKSTDKSLADMTRFTQHGHLIGTLEYMSPEQTDLDRPDVDTRSDVYSLGILLYELLTSSTPFSRNETNRVGFDKMRRMIREEHPVRPSQRVDALPVPLLASVSDQRSIESRRLIQTIRGELDWIVLKAIEKERNRRYETVSEFAADIQRYLDDEPVLACPPSTVYRIMKAARRYRRAVALTVVVAATILASAVFSTINFIDERAARLESERQQQIAQEHAKKAAAAERKADVNLTLARMAIDRIMTRVAETQLSLVPELAPMRRLILKDAESFCDVVIRENPEDATAYRERAHVRELLGDHTGAREDRGKVAQLQPNDWQTHYSLAKSYLSTRTNSAPSKELAVKHSLKAVELAPHRSDVRRQASQAYRSLGQTAPAVAQIQQALRFEPASVENNTELSLALLSNGDTEEALAAAQTAVGAASEARKPYWVLGQAYFALGRYEEALRAIDNQLLLQSWGLEIEEFELHELRAQCLVNLGRKAEAVTAWSKTIESGPLRALPHRQRGAIYLQLSQYPESLADLSLAMQLEPTNLETLFMLSLEDLYNCHDPAFRAGTLGLFDAAIASKGATQRLHIVNRTLRIELLGHRAFEDYSICRDVQDPGMQHYYILVHTVNFIAKSGTSEPHAHDQMLDHIRYWCKRMIEQRFEGKWQLLTHWTVALSPDIVEDYQPILLLAKEARDATPNAAIENLVYGALLFRAGRANEAVDWLQKSADLAESDPCTQAHARFLLALANHELGRSQAARDSYLAAAQWTDDALRAAEEKYDPTLPWSKRASLEILQKEAESQLGLEELAK